jgi:hypothetical protein
MNGFQTQTHRMSDEEKRMSLEIWCDLLEAELKRALEDLSVIRGLDKAQAKSKSRDLDRPHPVAKDRAALPAPTYGASHFSHFCDAFIG